jgi:hypothetical protein
LDVQIVQHGWFRHSGIAWLDERSYVQRSGVARMTCRPALGSTPRTILGAGTPRELGNPVAAAFVCFYLDVCDLLRLSTRCNCAFNCPLRMRGRNPAGQAGVAHCRKAGVAPRAASELLGTGAKSVPMEIGRIRGFVTP